MSDILNDLPAWGVMATAAGVVFFVFKWMSWRRLAFGESPPVGRTLGYFFAWVGMDAAAFVDVGRCVARPTMGEWTAALAKTAIGVALLWSAAPRLLTSIPFAAGWVGMIGIVMLFHFGAFHLLALAWRRRGIAAERIMDRPLYSTSLADFWGRRWNKAFRDVADAAIFRPLAARIGPQPALVAVFLFSGLVHDVVISLPAQAGYGRPTLYFLLQAAAICVARSTIGRRLGIDRGRGGRVFAAVVLVAPLGLLFHRPFVERVIVPLVLFIGGP